jgi:hypothetical protein
MGIKDDLKAREIECLKLHRTVQRLRERIRILEEDNATMVRTLRGEMISTEPIDGE